MDSLFQFINLEDSINAFQNKALQKCESDTLTVMIK